MREGVGGSEYCATVSAAVDEEKERIWISKAQREVSHAFLYSRFPTPDAFAVYAKVSDTRATWYLRRVVCAFLPLL